MAQIVGHMVVSTGEESALKKQQLHSYLECCNACSYHYCYYYLISLLKAIIIFDALLLTVACFNTKQILSLDHQVKFFASLNLQHKNRWPLSNGELAMTSIAMQCNAIDQLDLCK